MSTTSATVITTAPKRINYEHQKGDGWAPGSMTVYQGGTIVNGAVVGGTLVNFTGATGVMEIRKGAPNGAVVRTLDNGANGGLVLTSLGVITPSMTGAQTDAIPAGIYYYRLVVTPSAGEPKSYTFGTFIMIDTPNE